MTKHGKKFNKKENIEEMESLKDLVCISVLSPFISLANNCKPMF